MILLSALCAEAQGPSHRRTPVVQAVERVGPAVVNIFTEEAPRTRKNPFSNFLGDNVFDQFFRDFTPPASKRRSLGSGVLIHPDGYILTNEHVVTQAVRIQVTLADNREFEARLVGADIKSDLAVIKIDAKQALPHVKMGRSDDIMIGETVIAIGNPFGLKHTVTTGIISALDRTIRASKKQVYTDFIQVDASINPGNSGGPLLNIDGSLIGINTAIFQKAQGIGFAIPINTARRIVDDLIEFGQVHRGWLGLSVQNMDANLISHFDLDRVRGVLVTKVFNASPAARAGLEPGDVLLQIDDHELGDKADFNRKVASYTLGDSLQMGYQRQGIRRTVKMKVDRIPDKVAIEFAQEWLGISVEGINKSFVKRFRLATSKGVIVTHVIPSSVSGRTGIRAGDVIRQINRTLINAPKDFNRAILDARKHSSVVLLVQRGQAGYYVTLEP